MKLLKRIKRVMTTDTISSLEPKTSLFQIVMDKAKRHKRAGRYTSALNEFEHAATMVENDSDGVFWAMIALHRVDIYIIQEMWEDADNLLKTLKQQAETRNNKTQLAYVYSAMGTQAQAKSDWNTTQSFYEKALETATEAFSIGAKGRAQGHLADVYLHQGNASYAVRLLSEALMHLEVSGDTELIVYFMGRLGIAQVETGQNSEGQQNLGRALRLAVKMQYRRYEIMWRQALAIYAMQSGLYGEGKRQLSLILAQPDIKETKTSYLSTLCQISKAYLHLRDYSSALDYAQQAIEPAEKLSKNNDLYLKSRAVLGVALRATGQYMQAIECLEEIHEQYVQISVNGADYTYVDVLRNLATAQMETSNFQIAAGVYERALNHAEKNEHPLEVAGTNRDIGVLHIRQRNFEKALEFWKTALQIYTDNAQYTDIALMYCDIATIRKQLGQNNRSLNDYSQALMLLSSVKDHGTRGYILSNAAIAYADRGDAESAASFFEESIKIAQKTKDPQAEATRHGNYGWFLMSVGKLEEALKILDKAIQQSQRLGLILQTAVQTDNIGLVYNDMGNYEQAIDYHRRALEIIKEIDSPQWEATIGVNLGHTLASLGQLDEASSHFAAALETGRETRNMEIIACALIGQTKTALELNQIKIAEKPINEAVALARKYELSRMLARALTIRGDFYYRSDQANEASADWDEASKLWEMLRGSIEGKVPSWLVRE
jgi:tetratricopeptide (TPR) repeat protein